MTNILEKMYSTIRQTGYEWAEEVYNNWSEIVEELRESEEDSNESDFIATDSKPNYEAIEEVLWERAIWAKSHQMPEDILGDDYSEEELDSYDLLTDEELADILEVGFKEFLNKMYS